MEVYAAFFNGDLNEIKKIEAVTVDEHSFSDLLSESKVFFSGDRVPKCVEVLVHHENAIIKDDFNPSTAFMATLSETKFNHQDFEDVVYFEPFYRKDFVAGIPKMKGLK